MEHQLPDLLAATVAAAGITAYADELVVQRAPSASTSTLFPEQAPPALH